MRIVFDLKKKNLNKYILVIFKYIFEYLVNG